MLTNKAYELSTQAKNARVNAKGYISSLKASYPEEAEKENLVQSLENHRFLAAASYINGKSKEWLTRIV